MGFLSKLFGESSNESKLPIELDGPGTFSVEVVGESYYQKHLHQVFGDHSESEETLVVDAHLIHDNRNQYDDKAIRVEIMGKRVGHLNRSQARHFRSQMQANGWGGMTAVCEARIEKNLSLIVIGSDVPVQLGVVLDLREDFNEAFGSPAPIDSREDHLAESNILIFEIDKPDTAELKLCKLGDYASLWTPKDNPGKVNIYRRGSIGGTGRIGFVPSKYAKLIASHLSKGLEYESEVIELSERKCIIECHLLSEEETQSLRSAQEQAQREKLRDELTKQYNPRKPIELIVDLEAKNVTEAGAKLQIEFHDLDTYLAQPYELSLVFIDQDGNKVSIKKDERDTVKKILRAHFNSYDFHVTVQSMKVDRGWYNHPAKIIVTPQKQS